MYRHLYKKPSIVNKYLQSEFQRYRSEELGFRNAALARLRDFKLQGKSDMDEFMIEWENLHKISIEEQLEISKNSLLPQIYQILSSLHMNTRSQQIIRYPQIEQISRISALLDPDMFPIQDLQDKLHRDRAISIFQDCTYPEINKDDNNIYQMNPYQILVKRIIKQIGFWLEVKQSNLDHDDANHGVFLKTQNGERQAGSLLGFVPGVTYNSYKDFQDPNQSNERHFFRFDGFIINFSEKIYSPIQPGMSMEEYSQKIQKIHQQAKLSRLLQKNIEKGGYEQVFGEEINPYAVGHLINHPGPGICQNVSLIDIFIPKNFFPQNMMRFWPNVPYSTEKDYMQIDKYELPFIKEYQKTHIRGLGVIAIKDIHDGEELLLDYIDSSLFDITLNPPDWLIMPPPISPFITKGQFENGFTLLSDLFENYVFSSSDDGKNYPTFIEKIKREKQFIDVITKN